MMPNREWFFFFGEKQQQWPQDTLIDKCVKFKSNFLMLISPSTILKSVITILIHLCKYFIIERGSNSLSWCLFVCVWFGIRTHFHEVLHLFSVAKSTMCLAIAVCYVLCRCANSLKFTGTWFGIQWWWEFLFLISSKNGESSFSRATKTPFTTRFIDTKSNEIFSLSFFYGKRERVKEKANGKKKKRSIYNEQ